MSRATTTDRSRERQFLLGAVGGCLLTATGFVALVLALSVNVRGPVTEVPMIARSVGVYGGLSLGAVGYVLRRHPWGRRLAVLGVVVFVLAGSTAVAPRSGAPYVSQADRWAIAVAALAFLAGGIRTIRAAARRVGWT